MDQQVHESELLIPALRIIMKKPGIDTSGLKKELEKVVNLYPKDLEILKNRNDNYFSQTVRNLCGSHLLTNEFGKCVTVEKKGKINCFKINEYGRLKIKDDEYSEMEETIDDEAYQKEISTSNTYDEIDLKKVSERKPQKNETSISKGYKKDPRIAKTVIANNNYKCEYANLNGYDHTTFTTKAGVQYQEGHHLIPMKAQKDFEKNIDRPENIVSLCPTCHRAIHNARKDEKVEILNKIYNDKIKKLNEIGINISFEDLYNKYYV